MLDVDKHFLWVFHVYFNILSAYEHHNNRMPDFHVALFKLIHNRSNIETEIAHFTFLFFPSDPVFPFSLAIKRRLGS